MVPAVLMVILATLFPTINCQVMYQHILAAKLDLLRVNNCVRSQQVCNALVSEETCMALERDYEGLSENNCGSRKSNFDIVRHGGRHTWHLGYQSSASHFQLGAHHLYIADINYGEFPFEKTS